jgi:hypothetical protein
MQRSHPSLSQQPPLPRRNLLTLTLLIVTLWLATRPYPGIYNDARFYTLQALNALHPGRYADDLYFKYGSQDQFTIFTKLFAPLVGAVGMSAANIIGLLLSQFLWLTGLAYFAFGFFNNRRDAILGLAIVIILPFHIGFIDSGERFLTPRLPAEAICLWALGAMLRGRPFLCLVLMAAALPLHPLLALGAFGVFFVYQALEQPLWWLAAIAGCLIGLALAFTGIQPFARLFATIDPAWLAVINIRDSFCFIANWGFYIWLPIASATALCVNALLIANPAERRLLLACLITGWGGIVVSLIGGDLLHNVLILDAQLWRSFWPAGIVSYFFLPAILRNTCWRGPVFFINAQFFWRLALIWLLITSFSNSLLLIAAPLAVLAAITGIYEHKTHNSLPPAAGMLFAGLAFGLSALGLFGLYLAARDPYFRQDYLIISLITVLPAIYLLLVSLGIAKLPRQLNVRAFSLTATCLILFISISQWDHRTDWLKYLDHTSTPPPDLVSLLAPAGGQIYWEGSATGTTDLWYLLQRPDYFSCDQGTGTLFSRQTAMVYQARFNSFAKLHTQDFTIPEICPPSGNADPDHLTQPDLTAVCRAQPSLGAMVLLHDIPGAPHKTWIAPAMFDYVDPARPTALTKTNHFYIYTCGDLK